MIIAKKDQLPNIGIKANMSGVLAQILEVLESNPPSGVCDSKSLGIRKAAAD